jgi:hypothetical protein
MAGVGEELGVCSGRNVSFAVILCEGRLIMCMTAGARWTELEIGEERAKR